MSKQINYDHILNREEALREYQKYLIPLYIDDYTEKNLKRIKKRINNTLYIFDSTPIEELEYLKEHNLTLPLKEEERLEKEYKDYEEFSKKITQKNEKTFYSYLSQEFNVVGRKIKELYSLDIDSFGREAKYLLKSDIIDESVKEEIISRQIAYLEECKRLHVTPITKTRTIENLFITRNDMKSFTDEEIIKNTLWGKRIRRRILDETGYKIPLDFLEDILFSEMADASVNYITDDKNNISVCYFPLMRLLNQGNVDSSFYHENRHVIEQSKKGQGICSYKDLTYEILNEIRTEKNAQKDTSSLQDKVLFSKEGYKEGRINSYQKLFPHTYNFFDDYRTELNLIAIRNDIKKLNTMFGKKNLKKFASYLDRILLWNYYEYPNLEKITDIEKERQMVKKLTDNFITRKK